MSDSRLGDLKMTTQGTFYGIKFHAKENLKNVLSDKNCIFA